MYATEQRVRLVEVGVQRLLCPLALHPLIDVAYCPSDRGVVYARTFVYGWQVHRLPRPAVARAGPPT